MIINSLKELLDQHTYTMVYAVKAGSLEEAEQMIDDKIQDELTAEGTLWNLCGITIDKPIRPKVYVMGKHAVEQLFDTEGYNGSQNVAIVSISSVIETPAEIKTKGPILKLVFDDVDIQTGIFEAQQAITPIQGEAISDFLKLVDYDTEIDAIIFQCAAGISRSSGAAAAYCEWSGNHDSKDIFNHPAYIPNMAVYRSVYAALMGIEEEGDGSSEEG